jgi:hypothetical protein
VFSVVKNNQNLNDYATQAKAWIPKVSHTKLVAQLKTEGFSCHQFYKLTYQEKYKIKNCSIELLKNNL